MLVRECYCDTDVLREATARMVEIERELNNYLALCGDPESAEAVALVAEYKALDGSWQKERMVEMDGILTHEEAAIREVETRREEARDERNRRLASCDWTTVADVPLTADQRAAWATYRQALRDVTKQAGFPDAIVWPEAP